MTAWWFIKHVSACIKQGIKMIDGRERLLCKNYITYIGGVCLEELNSKDLELVSKAREVITRNFDFEKKQSYCRCSHKVQKWEYLLRSSCVS